MLTAWLAYATIKFLPAERNDESEHLYAVASCVSPGL